MRSGLPLLCEFWLLTVSGPWDRCLTHEGLQHLHGSTKLVAPSRFAADVTPAWAGLASQGNGCEHRKSETHKAGTVAMNIDVTALLVKINKHFHLYDHDQQHRHHHHRRQRRPSHTHAATRQEQSGLQPHAVGLELPCPIDFCVAGPSLREATIENLTWCLFSISLCWFALCPLFSCCCCFRCCCGCSCYYNDDVCCTGFQVQGSGKSALNPKL